jgi:hypothetical protein
MKFELHSTDRGFRKGIIFLAGRGKTMESFNTTSTNKTINLELDFRTQVQTCLVEFDEDDVNLDSNPMAPLITALDLSIKWIIVASSIGAYFAEFIPLKLISGVVLIDPGETSMRTDYQCPVHIHVAISDPVSSNFALYAKMTAYNARSAVIVHYEASHLIHWSAPGKIRESIKWLLKN